MLYYSELLSVILTTVRVKGHEHSRIVQLSFTLRLSNALLIIKSSEHWREKVMSVYACFCSIFICFFNPITFSTPVMQTVGEGLLVNCHLSVINKFIIFHSAVTWVRCRT